MIPIITPISDMLVLSVLSTGDAYGYQISQILKPLSHTENPFSPYPTLKRLRKQGLLTTYNKLLQGRNQKYYRITDNGKRQYDAWVREWQTYKNTVDQIMSEGFQYGMQDYTYK